LITLTACRRADPAECQLRTAWVVSALNMEQLRAVLAASIAQGSGDGAAPPEGLLALMEATAGVVQQLDVHLMGACCAAQLCAAQAQASRTPTIPHMALHERASHACSALVQGTACTDHQARYKRWWWHDAHQNKKMLPYTRPSASHGKLVIHHHAIPQHKPHVHTRTSGVLQLSNSCLCSHTQLPTTQRRRLRPGALPMVCRTTSSRATAKSGLGNAMTTALTELGPAGLVNWADRLHTVLRWGQRTHARSSVPRRPRRRGRARWAGWL
jgi:hypothetical protein